MDIFWATSFFLFGAVLGSFGNVIIIRWPQEKSIVTPGSHCTQCDKPIPWYRNIPIVSFLFQLGRCFCEKKLKLSKQYLIVELATALLFLLAFVKFGPTITAVEIALFSFAAFTASVIDLKHYLLPDILTLSGIVIGLVGAMINPDRAWQDALIGVLLGGGLLWITAYLYLKFRGREGLGGGDIKLIAWIGAVLGWKAIPVVVFLASFVGAFIGLILAMRSKDGMQTVIPFGPYLSAAALIYVYTDAGALFDWYVETFLTFGPIEVQG